MTGLPAKILRCSDRGQLQPGMIADITVFDPENLKDQATFDDPHQYCSGLRYVFVNGVTAMNRGKVTGSLAGRALRFKAPDPADTSGTTDK